MARDRRTAAQRIAGQVLGQCFCGRINQVARVVNRRYDQALRSLGLTANQLTLLCVVAALDRPTQAEMIPYLEMDRSTLSRNLLRLRANGWVVAVLGTGLRSPRLRVTDTGAETIRQALPAWTETQAWARALLHADGAAAVRRVAKTVNPLIP